jgi:hypothetical protein
MTGVLSPSYKRALKWHFGVGKKHHFVPLFDRVFAAFFELFFRAPTTGVADCRKSSRKTAVFGGG